MHIQQLKSLINSRKYNMAQEKRYVIEVEVKFEQVEWAPNRQQAINNLKKSFLRDYNLKIEKEEIAGIHES